MPSLRFEKLSTIIPEKPQTWRGKIFLSLDFDWAHDEILDFAYQFLQPFGIATTWFATHDTEFLTVLRSDMTVEMGIHPNFNPLLEGTSAKGHSAKTVVDDCLDVVPEAKAVRSHSLAQSERLLDYFSEKGLSHVANSFVPFGNGNIRPFRLWGGLTVCPHGWQDNAALRLGHVLPEIQDESDNLVVLNVHPIHLFLNTQSLDVYEESRHVHHNPMQLLKYRAKGAGILAQLQSFLEENSELVAAPRNNSASAPIHVFGGSK